MSNYDVAISMDQATLNRIVTSLFARPALRSKLFSGTQTATFAGVNATVGWEVQEAPVLNLQAPAPSMWQHAVKQDGGTQPPSANAFVLHLPKLKVSRNVSTGGVQETVVPLDVICTAGLANNQLRYNALAVVVDLSSASAFDQAIYKAIIIPKVLQMASSILGNQHIPNLDFHGTQFGPVVLSIGNGRIAGVANLAGKPAPVNPSFDSIPSLPFAVLLSQQVVQQVAQQGSQGLQGKTANTGGSQSFGIGDASYNASLRIDRVSVTVSGDLTVAHAAVQLAASASAGVSVLSTIGGAVVSGATTAANAVANAGSTAVNAVADAGSTAVNAIGKAFSGY